MSEYQLIKDITYEYNADLGLEYSSPCRGVWNIVHIGTLVPGSHQIYVCPTSCLRGVVLTTAEMGAMDRLSTITVGEDNILEGDLEERILFGTRKIIDSLPTRPRVVMIFISCIHHFMAANYQRVYNLLREEYPDIDFVDAYMDPIMRRKTPPVPSLMRQIYRVMKSKEHVSNQVSYIDNWFPADEYSDLSQHLEKNGITIRDLSKETDYDRFKEMQNSCVNFTFHKYGAWAGRDLMLRLNQKWQVMRPTYDFDLIDADMKEACELLNIPCLSDEEIAEERRLTEERLSELHDTIGDTEISIDYTAVDEPLSLAVCLLKHGFNVQSIFIENFTETEDVFNELVAIRPDLRIYSAQNWNMRIVDRDADRKVLGIGQKAAYYHNSAYFVDIIMTAGMYGYRGLRHLCDLIEEANRNEKDMRTLIQHKGWRCSAK